MNKQLAIIMIIITTAFIGFGIVIPIMPELMSHFHLNLMLAAYSLASFIMSPIWGSISDRIGRRPVILLGLIGYGASFLILSFSTDSLTWMYISRIIGGLFSGAVISCAVAYVADVTSEADRTKGMGLVGMSIGFGFIIGPALGGLLSVFGHFVPLILSAILSFILILFVLKFLAESLPPEKRVSKGQKQPSRFIAFKGKLKYLYILSFFVTFTLAGLEGTMQYYQIKIFDATPTDMGLMFLITGIVSAAIQGGVVRRYVKQGTESKFIMLGLMLSSIGFFLIIYSQNFWTATFYMTIFAAGNSLIRPCVLSLITQKTTVPQGVATGLNSSMDSLGRIAGPLMALALYQIKDIYPFLAGGILCLLALWLLRRFIKLDVRVSE